ncbi:hypothetical protein PsYK624_091010 [Phanerochaete sordida]|uniref:Uncharacterized protein n=1 Tax=Phanerochaete sordida TaxID=48140 RepID=A0A9P3GDW3_9APHY|nr:hypothetical protein PsYK624_091010 [Phanerochaete sordida]
MFSKLNSFLKPRPDLPPSPLHDDGFPTRGDDSEIPFPAPRPVSPTESGRGGMMKRVSRSLSTEAFDTIPRIAIPKKVKSSIMNFASGSDHSLSRASAEIFTRQSQETTRPSTESVRTPITPVSDAKLAADGKFGGSLRSILKPNNTPGTGRSVRFFSRDAYRVISPEASSASEIEDPKVFNRLQKSAASRPTAQQVFSAPPPPPPAKDAGPSTPGLASMMAPLSPPEVSNIFDASGDELPTIPTGISAPLLDSAVEISDTDEQDKSLSFESIDKDQISVLTASPTIKMANVVHDRSHSFSFGQTLFRSAAEVAAESSPAAKQLSPKQRNRASSDTILASMIHPPASALGDPKPPEADINDTSNAVVAYQATVKERDPFAANASTYYTPGTMLPPSPPQSNHTRTASREEDLIWSLRTQLALKSEICTQFEVDLSAKDELVEILNARLGDSERELDRRKNIIRNWRRRVSELEKCVRNLEDEVERSREESAERSVMDEASGEALRMLHRRINDLEREKKEGDQRGLDLRTQLDAASAQLSIARDELQTRGDGERELAAGTKAANEPPQALEDRERLMSQKLAWENERAALVATHDALRNDHLTLQSQLGGLREDVFRKEEELVFLKAELEAQWKHTEQSSEEISRLRQERDAFSREADELREKMAGAGSDWDARESRYHELEQELEEAWAARDELDRERDELEKHLRAEQDHAEELTRALQEREQRVSNLEQEHRYAYDNVSRLQDGLRQRDAELAEQTMRVREREAEAEELREGLTKQKREHARIVDEQSRKISEVVAREVEARHTMERLVREKAENDVEAGSLQERVDTLQGEVDRLRKQVHDLQQESADKEVKLTQAAKQRAKDKEDMQGLNIALDSKQQELELLKRRMGTRASVGQSTTAKPPGRRESSIFATPSIVRPASAMSDASSTSREPSTVTKTSTLARRPPTTVMNAATKRLESINAPTVRPRSSLVTPSATSSRLPPSSMPRSNAITPGTQTHRRTISSSGPLRGRKLASGTDSNASVSEHEKENIDEATPVARKTARRLSVALPA